VPAGISAVPDYGRKTMFLQQLINALTIGSLYALTAMGATLIYGILGKIGNKALILALSNYLSHVLYFLFRMVYSINRDNPSGFFSVDDQVFRSGAVHAKMMEESSRIYLEVEAMRQDKALQEKLDIIDQKLLEREFPALYQSLFQVLHTTSTRLNSELKQEPEKGRRK
jgi:hypothetical protein